jgi:hypothetical protein
MVYRPSRGSILSLHPAIVSVHGPPRLHFEPLKLLNFDLNADPDLDLAFHSNADPDSMLIRIRNAAVNFTVIFLLQPLEVKTLKNCLH